MKWLSYMLFNTAVYRVVQLLSDGKKNLGSISLASFTFQRYFYSYFYSFSAWRLQGKVYACGTQDEKSTLSTQPIIR